MNQMHNANALLASNAGAQCKYRVSYKAHLGFEGGLQLFNFGLSSVRLNLSRIASRVILSINR